MSARRALAFLTPLGGASPPSPASLAWFPVVGAALGGTLGALWWGATRIWPVEVAAAIVVVADLALTGMLHFDGLTDCADGLLPHLPQQRRLEVMTEPTVGAFGVLVAVAALGCRWVALASIRPSTLLLVGVWTASRTVMALAASYLPYAKAGGLASGFLGANRVPGLIAGVVGSAIALGAVVAWHPVAGPVALAAGLCAAGGVLLLATRRIGGYTGDVLGAAGVLCETAALLVASAKW